jgi:hypothetical protein
MLPSSASGYGKQSTLLTRAGIGFSQHITNET